MQTLMETVTVIIPEAMNNIFKAIKDLIDGFGKVFKNPKEGIAVIGKGVMRYILSKTST